MPVEIGEAANRISTRPSMGPVSHAYTFSFSHNHSYTLVHTHMHTHSYMHTIRVMGNEEEKEGRREGGRGG